MNSEITNEQDQIDEPFTALPASVKITGINIPIWDMMIFMIKWAFASVPVIIFFSILWMIITAIFLGVGTSPNLYDLR